MLRAKLFGAAVCYPAGALRLCCVQKKRTERGGSILFLEYVREK